MDNALIKATVNNCKRFKSSPKNNFVSSKHRNNNRNHHKYQKSNNSRNNTTRLTNKSNHRKLIHHHLTKDIYDIECKNNNGNCSSTSNLKINDKNGGGFTR